MEIGAQWVHGEKDNPLHQFCVENDLLTDPKVDFSIEGKGKDHAYTIPATMLERLLRERKWNTSEKLQIVFLGLFLLPDGSEVSREVVEPAVAILDGVKEELASIKNGLPDQRESTPSGPRRCCNIGKSKLILIR